MSFSQRKIQTCAFKPLYIMLPFFPTHPLRSQAPRTSLVILGHHYPLFPPLDWDLHPNRAEAGVATALAHTTYRMGTQQTFMICKIKKESRSHCLQNIFDQWSLSGDTADKINLPIMLWLTLDSERPVFQSCFIQTDRLALSEPQLPHP